MQAEDPSQTCHIKKKRVGKACDSCRIKKTKCDGKKPCNRCLLDNKICVFTEKRKIKEKNHPPGYIELLETRLDILSKSFEKLIELSRPHLSFIDEILQDEVMTKREYGDDMSPSPTEAEESDKANSIPNINKVVSYLIGKRGLLQNVPIEWEEGALIAANLEGDNLQSSSKSFAEHKAERLVGSESASSMLHSSPRSKPLNRTNSTSSTKSHIKKKVKEEPVSPNSLHSFSCNVNGNSNDNSNLSSGNFNLNADDQWLANDAMLSEFDSDSPERNHGVSPPSIHEHKRRLSGDYNGHNHIPLTASLFSNNFLPSQPISKNSSVTSLSNKYEAHTLTSAPNSSTTATPLSSIFTSNSPITMSTLRRSSSTLSQTQHNKLKSCIAHHHHVHKPTHHNRQGSIDLKKRNNSVEISPAGSVHDLFSNSQPSSAVASLADEFNETDRYYDATGEGITLQSSFAPSITNESMERTIDDSFYNGVARGPSNIQGPGAFDVLIGAYEDSFNNNRSFLEKY
ncbi:FCR1 [Candida margitis]|uniref:FCR1 n=1 Tax=Candida margitis TaxID=1775924 RepID=UPI0022267879|nr:FCR1 [Candida margitis]KAI5968133.1 FCR1 [Candida margitis]